MAAKRAKSAGSEKAAGRAPGMPKIIYAQASPRSAGGVSLFEAFDRIEAATVAHFASEQSVLAAAEARLREAGFEVLQVSSITINIAGPKEAYERAFKTSVVAEERTTFKSRALAAQATGRGGPPEETATFLDCPETTLPGLIATQGTPFEDLLEGVALEEPRYFMQPSMFPPPKAYWHLTMPGDVSLGCNADRAHRAGLTGRGVRVAMADSGWFQHPYFVGRGYRVAPVVLGPAAANPLADEVGHGTGESANIFAVAPDVEFLPVKMSFVNTVGGFNAAVGLHPDIITCSWGSHKPNGPLSAADMALAAAIAAAVASGITVIFSAGNGQAGFPGQHPDVISAGGVFMDQDGSLQASNYASGFMSNIYAGRRVPDLCGLVGLQPKAIYLMLPLEPGDEIDRSFQGGRFPNGDETGPDDGWAAFSGTSAAAPQLAGAAALIKQACPGLTPADVKDILRRTARDVTAGVCSPVPGIHGGLPAGPGPDAATGDGLVDAQRAALMARVRCLGPIRPISVRPPIAPIVPVVPVRPIVGPITPVQPVLPIEPVQPVRPIEPVQPVLPVRPIEPIILPAPASPAGTGQEGGGGDPTASAKLSAEEVQALEQIIVESENLPEF
jgi:hypothetical protein